VQEDEIREMRGDKCKHPQTPKCTHKQQNNKTNANNQPTLTMGILYRIAQQQQQHKTRTNQQLRMAASALHGELVYC